MSAASEMARRLAREAEAVCRHYLPHGRREGRYWRVGDVHGTPGQSLYVRLHGTATGRWADAATGEHGDLLDLIGLNRGLGRLAAVLDEARAFLCVPRAPPERRWEPPAPSALTHSEGAGSRSSLVKMVSAGLVQTKGLAALL